MRWMVVLVASLMALSGCSTDADEPTVAPETPQDTTEPTATATATTTATSSKTEAPPQEPGDAGHLEVTLLAEATSGVEPFTTNLTLDVTAVSDASPPISWNITLVLENGTRSLLGADGALPFTTNLTLGQGNHTLLAWASAPDHGTASAELVLAVAAYVPPPPPAPAFFDDAESGMDQWDVEGYLLLTDANLVGPGIEEEVPESSAWGTWTSSTENAHAGTSSFWSQYPDFYLTRMTSKAFLVPDDGTTYTLSYWFAGGAEMNSYDGLYVSIGKDGSFDQLAFHDESTDWKQDTFPLTRYAGQEVQIQFMFKTDASCSQMTDVPDNPILGCGAGEFEGYFLDDIRVHNQ